jgi:hypothetical protein
LQPAKKRFNTSGLGFVGLENNSHGEDFSSTAPGKLKYRNLLVAHDLKDTHLSAQVAVHEQ